MLAALALTAFAAAGSAWLAAIAIRDHRQAAGRRASLLDDVAGAIAGAQVAVRPDGYPTVTGRLADRRQISVELVHDTMVMRRLPQLWVCVTLLEPAKLRRPSLGALARPTGAEFYSQLFALPERVDAPLTLETGLLIRSDRRLAGAELRRGVFALRQIFGDPKMKEALATGGGVRVVRQACEGERGAHLLLRQARFSTAKVPLADVEACIAAADVLRQALDTRSTSSERLSA